MDGNDKALFDGLVDVRARGGWLVGWLLTLVTRRVAAVGVLAHHLRAGRISPAK